MHSTARVSKVKTQVFCAIVILSSALGNFALARGLKDKGQALAQSPLSYIQAIFSPWVLLGISLLTLWLLSRMALLSWADLSYVLPVTSLGYVVTALIGKVFLDEQVSWQRWAGTLLIVAGTAVVGITSSETNRPQGVHSEATSNSPETVQ